MARIAQDSGREPPNSPQIHAHHALKSRAHRRPAPSTANPLVTAGFPLPLRSSRRKKHDVPPAAS